MAKQQMRQTHKGTAAFLPWIQQRGQAGHQGPSRDAASGASSWLSGPVKQHSGRSPQLDSVGRYPYQLITAQNWLHRAARDRGLYRQLDARRGYQGAEEWAGYYHQRTHEKYVDVPLWAVLGAPGTVNRTSSLGNYSPFRRAQPAIKAQSLAQALAASARAIQAASNG